MSHTNLEQYHGYSVHATSEKHDTGKWGGSFHIMKEGRPVISISVLEDGFDSAEVAAQKALQQGRLYIDREVAEARL